MNNIELIMKIVDNNLIDILSNRFEALIYEEIERQLLENAEEVTKKEIEKYYYMLDDEELAELIIDSATHNIVSNYVDKMLWLLYFIR